MRLSYMAKSIGAYMVSYSGGIAPIVKVQDNDKCVICYKYAIMEDDVIHYSILNNYLIPSGKVKSKEFDGKNIFYYQVEISESVAKFIKDKISVYKEDYYYEATNIILLAIMNVKETDITFYALDPTDEKVLMLFNNFESKVTLYIIKNTYSATPKVYSNYLPEMDAILVKAYKK